MFTKVTQFRDLDEFNYGDHVTINSIEGTFSGVIHDFKNGPREIQVHLLHESANFVRYIDISDIIWICHNDADLDLGI